VALLGAIVYVIYVQALACSSGNAVLGAPLTLVRAPIPGIVKMQPLKIGQRVATNATLGRVEGNIVDQSFLNLLAQELEVATAEIDTIRNRTTHGEQRHSLAQSEAQKTLNAKRVELQGRRDHAGAALKALDSKRTQLVSILDRATFLSAQGVISAERREQLEADVKQTEAAMHQLAAEAGAAEAMLQGSLASIETYARRQSDEIDVQLGEMSTHLARLEATRKATEHRLESEMQLLRQRTFADLVSPLAGRIWSINAGGYVNNNTPVLAIASCERAMVFAEVTPRDFKRVRPGTKATFKMRGGAKLSGSVVQKLNTLDGHDGFALAVPLASKKYPPLVIVIELVGTTLQQIDACPIGEVGKVEFDVPWLSLQ
jgi:multidrug efflux pump subunit AcrA (membrane-fusion protein)